MGRTNLQPGLRKSITEFSREAAQLSREDRHSTAMEAQKRADILITTARMDGFDAGRSVGWRRGFVHGLVTVVILLMLFVIWRVLRG